MPVHLPSAERGGVEPQPFRIEPLSRRSSVHTDITLQLDNNSGTAILRACYRIIAAETTPPLTPTPDSLEESHAQRVVDPETNQSQSSSIEESRRKTATGNDSSTSGELLRRVRLGSSNDQDPVCHYCIVRRDLPFGTQAAQLIHAAGESSPGNLPSSTFAVALTCRDENELHQLAIRLDRAGIDFHLVREPDVPYNNQLMAIGIRPILKSKVRKLLSNLPLLK